MSRQIDLLQSPTYQLLVKGGKNQPPYRFTVDADHDDLNDNGKKLAQQCLYDAQTKTGRFRSDMRNALLLLEPTPCYESWVGDRIVCQPWYNKKLATERITTSTIILFSAKEGWALTKAGTIFSFTLANPGL